jgi:hypothetical protein
MFELSLRGIWIVFYVFLAIWWTYIALYVGMVLRSTKLVSPALSPNISDSHLCRNLHCCNYSIKVLPSGVTCHKGDCVSQTWWAQGMYKNSMFQWCIMAWLHEDRDPNWWFFFCMSSIAVRLSGHQYAQECQQLVYFRVHSELMFTCMLLRCCTASQNSIIPHGHIKKKHIYIFVSRSLGPFSISLVRSIPWRNSPQPVQV